MTGLKKRYETLQEVLIKVYKAVHSDQSCYAVLIVHFGQESVYR